MLHPVQESPPTTAPSRSRIFSEESLALLAKQLEAAWRDVEARASDADPRTHRDAWSAKAVLFTMGRADGLYAALLSAHQANGGSPPDTINARHDELRSRINAWMQGPAGVIPTLTVRCAA